MAVAETARLVAQLDFKNNATRGVQSAITGFQRLGVAAGAGVVGAIALGIRSLDELDRANRQTAAVIESTGGKAGVTAKQVSELAGSLESLTTADDKAIQSGANMLLTFTNIGEKAFPRALKATTDLAIAMAEGDVENANFADTAIQIGKALNDPIKGVGALSRVGVSFTDQQKEQIKTLVESGRVYEAQTVILKELETEFGKAGEAAGQGPGAAWRRLQDVGEDLTQALARGVLPALTRVADFLSRKLSDERVLRTLDGIGSALGVMVDKGLAFIETFDFGAVVAGLTAAKDIAGTIVSTFMSLPPWVQTAVVTGWGLNKLTGGALADVVGSLASGLIKGVLGINAGVVNVKAATVTGAGGVPAGGGAGGGRFGGKLSIGNFLGAVGIAAVAAPIVAELVNIKNAQSEANAQQAADLGTQTREFAGRATLEAMQQSLAGIEAYDAKLSSELTPEAIAYQLNIDGVRDAVKAQEATLRTAIGAAAALQAQRTEGAEARSAATVAAAQDRQRHAMSSSMQAVRDAVNADRRETAAILGVTNARLAGALNRPIPAPVVNVTVRNQTTIRQYEYQRRARSSSGYGHATVTID